MKIKRSILSIIMIPYLCLIPLLAYSEQKIALVIGNSDYKISPLKNPVNDARLIADILSEAGFKVLKHEDINQKQMKKAINSFGRLLDTADIGLFYFAGHGVQFNGKNFLVPVNAQIQYESDIEVESVDLNRILAKMEGAKNGMNLVILDACRNNPFTRSFRSLSRGLAFSNAPSGTLIAYATAPGDVALDGAGNNGLYTSKLAKYMSTPNLRIEDVFKKVRIEVKNDSEGIQIPWESSSLEGDFYFFKQQIAVPKLPSNNTQYQVDQLLTRAATALRQQNYINNPPNDAVSLYRQVLNRQANNNEAKTALNNITYIFYEKASQAESSNDFITASLYASYGLSISPNNQQLQSLKQNITAKINDQSSELLSTKKQLERMAREKQQLMEKQQQYIDGIEKQQLITADQQKYINDIERQTVLNEQYIESIKNNKQPDYIPVEAPKRTIDIPFGGF